MRWTQYFWKSIPAKIFHGFFRAAHKRTLSGNDVTHIRSCQLEVSRATCNKRVSHTRVTGLREISLKRAQPRANCPCSSFQPRNLISRLRFLDKNHHWIFEINEDFASTVTWSSLKERKIKIRRFLRIERNVSSPIIIQIFLFERMFAHF